LSLEQQLTEEAAVWLCAMLIFDAAEGTFADNSTPFSSADASAAAAVHAAAQTDMAQWGRMAIFAVALTFLGAAAAYALQLSLEQKAHELVHDVSSRARERRELHFASNLAEIVGNAAALLVGRTWHRAIVGVLSRHGYSSAVGAMAAYAVLATALALWLGRRIAAGLAAACAAKLQAQPSLQRVRGMSAEEARRDPLPPMLRRLVEQLSVDADYDPALDDPPRSKVTALGALAGVCVGAVAGACVGDARYGGLRGAAVGAIVGGALLAGLGAAAAAVVGVLLYPDPGDGRRLANNAAAEPEAAASLTHNDGAAAQAQVFGLMHVRHGKAVHQAGVEMRTVKTDVV
jgi:hypothetical protein